LSEKDNAGNENKTPNIRLPRTIPNRTDRFVGHEELIYMIAGKRNIIKRKYNIVQSEYRILKPEKNILNMLLILSFAKAAIP
jgi:hypothetical protein